ncbi:MAG: hypothetical protein HZA00_06420 [Nitrospinae bacterium]|nr:hypothetical protein [Nitrospinota bacterium]
MIDGENEILKRVSAKGRNKRFVEMIKLRFWQALVILFFMLVGFIRAVSYIYKQADEVAILRVKSEITTGVKQGTPFFLKGSNIKLTPKGKTAAEISIAQREYE